jgi:hypothetical protein
VNSLSDGKRQGLPNGARAAQCSEIRGLYRFLLRGGMALRKNPTGPPVLLGFCERRFPGTADVWRRRDSPGAYADGGFRSIQALLGVARATQRTSACDVLGFWPRAGDRYATAADVEPSGLRRIGALEGCLPWGGWL